MSRKEYLSNVIKEKGFSIEKDKLNLIIAPTGTGKTTYFFSDLAKEYTYNRIVYLVDTNMLEDAMLEEYKSIMKNYNKNWFNELKYNEVKKDNKIVVMSYQKFGLLIKHNIDILKDIDLIVIDEAHNLLKYSELDVNKLSNDFTYAKEEDIKIALQYLNGCSNLAYNITRYIDNYNIDVVMMTATPNRILNHKPYKNYLHEVLQGYNIKGYDEENVFKFDNIKNVYKYIKEYRKMNSKTKYLCYSQTIDSCKTIEENLKNIGLNPIVLWSLNNKNNMMSNEQLTARQYIIEKKKIPSAYDVLIITGAYETGWNLEDLNCNFVIVNTSDNDTRIQVRGRVRHDIEILFYKDNYSKSYVNLVPEEYLNKPLTTNEKNELVKYYDLYNSKGRLLKWNSIKSKIIDSGKYIVTSGKKNINDKQIRFDIIEEIKE